MFQQASTGLSHLLLVDGGGVDHHLHPLHGGGAAGGRGGQHRVSQHRLHHRAHRQLHCALLHRRVLPPLGHLPEQGTLPQGPSERCGLRRHHPLLRLHPARGSGGLRDYREDGEDHPVGQGHASVKVGLKYKNTKYKRKTKHSDLQKRSQ